MQWTWCFTPWVVCNLKLCILQTHRVQKCLQKLLRSLHKDRHHTISHYRHLLSSSLEQAEREKALTLEHLVDIDHTVNQSLQMLQRYGSRNQYNVRDNCSQGILSQGKKSSYLWPAKPKWAISPDCKVFQKHLKKRVFPLIKVVR